MTEAPPPAEGKDRQGSAIRHLEIARRELRRVVADEGADPQARVGAMVAQKAIAAVIAGLSPKNVVRCAYAPCGKEFLPLRAEARFCSNTCRAKHSYRARRIEEGE